MKLTDTIKNQADRIIKVTCTEDIPLEGLPLKIAKTELRFNGFYSFTNAKTNEKTLIIYK